MPNIRYLLVIFTTFAVRNNKWHEKKDGIKNSIYACCMYTDMQQGDSTGV